MNLRQEVLLFHLLERDCCLLDVSAVYQMYRSDGLLLAQNDFALHLTFLLLLLCVLLLFGSPDIVQLSFSFRALFRISAMLSHSVAL